MNIINKKNGAGSVAQSDIKIHMKKCDLNPLFTSLLQDALQKKLHPIRRKIYKERDDLNPAHTIPIDNINVTVAGRCEVLYSIEETDQKGTVIYSKSFFRHAIKDYFAKKDGR